MQYTMSSDLSFCDDLSAVKHYHMLLWLIKKTYFKTAVATLNLNWAQSVVSLREGRARNK